MSYTDFKGVAFGESKAGLATVGYQLFNPNGTSVATRITAGVLQTVPGTYGATVTFPDNFTGEVRWDTGEALPLYVSDFINDGGIVTTVPAVATSVRSVNFRDDILHGIAAELSIDFAYDLNLDHARAWCNFVNKRVRAAFRFWDWPELNITEERAFRPVWSSSKSYSASSTVDGLPEEFYYATDGQYYKTLAAAPAGTLPTNTTFFQVTTPVDRFIPYDQPGKQSIGKIISIYSGTPRAATSALNWNFAPSEHGIDLPAAAGGTVWITYQVREPVFTVTPYNAATAYARHALVYDTASGNVYRAILPNTGSPLSGTSWLLQAVPYVIAEYVKLAAAADAADDMALKADLATQARRALETEVDRLVQQGEKHFYSNGGNRRVPLGLSGFWWSVAAPYATAS